MAWFNTYVQHQIPCGGHPYHLQVQSVRINYTHLFLLLICTIGNIVPTLYNLASDITIDILVVSGYTSPACYQA